MRIVDRIILGVGVMCFIAMLGLLGIAAWEFPRQALMVAAGAVCTAAVAWVVGWIAERWL